MGSPQLCNTFFWLSYSFEKFNIPQTIRIKKLILIPKMLVAQIDCQHFNDFCSKRKEFMELIARSHPNLQGQVRETLLLVINQDNLPLSKGQDGFWFIEVQDLTKDISYFSIRNSTTKLVEKAQNFIVVILICFCFIWSFKKLNSFLKVSQRSVAGSR